MRSIFHDYGPYFELLCQLEPRAYIAAATRFVWQALNHNSDSKLEAAVTLAERYVCGEPIDSSEALLMSSAIENDVRPTIRSGSMKQLTSAAVYTLSQSVVMENQNTDPQETLVGLPHAMTAMQLALAVAAFAAVNMVMPLDVHSRKAVLKAINSRWLKAEVADADLADLNPVTQEIALSAFARVWGEFECSVHILSVRHSISQSPEFAEPTLHNFHTWVRAAAVRDALVDCDDETVDYFLSKVLEVRSGRDWSWEEMRRALAVILNQQQKWLSIEPTELRMWLQRAVIRQAKRLRRDVEMADRLWWGRRSNAPVLVPLEDLEVCPSEDPLEILLRKPEHVLDGLLHDEHPKLQVLGEMLLHGTTRDQQIIRLLASGYEPVDIASEFGVRWAPSSPWSPVQGLQKKAERWVLKKLRKNPPEDV